ncbi:MAG: Asp-tRNA(Asn)/Glu-tRNA(Gln) amidotransferase subunit GatC [Acidimicrobiia bacterium]|nr:Asp-tRNA(Asn)/Glu-tRNA(Gln) amidotransferase subunit GatC [Acidimicrobiia bacterium]MBT8250957.1 Asp-tRNA(Asn)/Glu-tRNA(Gln) amidotransferase subunit GatC [Acidimicrobiia bacterium]NNC41908.1 Asp-tRNA(Asn)/Glu-tRNA(Gln) amidotransferase subunit GatC [Acidimicrobiia bacterium]NND14570.1 Asp-tRNA(Asn)/Glu-tRNA(Gln) amidotransferase subunit GatC [Acidimicrobiia bacterium]NNL29123.1 Asp-tRNA(Asn)/Glu-tRNA(Gln) amidotransferase subunit GatC [Acidimicrobiia bacterium]
MSDTSNAGPVDIDIARVARLARIALSDTELATYKSQLPVILEHASLVQSLQTDGIEQTSHPLPLVNVFRADIIGSCLDRDEVLAQAPETQDHQFVVPRIMDEA